MLNNYSKIISVFNRKFQVRQAFYALFSKINRAARKRLYYSIFKPYLINRRFRQMWGEVS